MRSDYVKWFRQSSPYIHAFRGRTFVIACDGATVQHANFPALIHDAALLNSLGIRLVMVHGARPQIDQRLLASNHQTAYVNGLRITDDKALMCVKEAAGAVRVEIEALLSMGVANSPMAGAHITVASGNFVTAKPLGIREGVDYCHTGEVRRIDTHAIRQRLENGAIVLISPLGYSPTGEMFNVSSKEVATACATSLGADKLIFLADSQQLNLAQREQPLRELSTAKAKALLDAAFDHTGDPPYLHHAVTACEHGVSRVHLVDHSIDGGLLLELFTRDGIGALITGTDFEGMRQANIDDVGGLLELIQPLEQRGVLVRRSREQLELEIDRFTVADRDGAIIACVALYPYHDEHVGELACLVVHPDYRQANRGETLLAKVEHRAKQLGLEHLFVLTTQTAQWFQEHGYQLAPLEQLPVAKQQLYNLQRNSKVLIKRL